MAAEETKQLQLQTCQPHKAQINVLTGNRRTISCREARHLEQYEERKVFSLTTTK